MIDNLARFVTRPSENGKPDLLIGSFFIKQDYFTSNRVYELQNRFGVPTIVDKGPTWIGTKKAWLNWGNSIEYILDVADKSLILNENEYLDYIKSGMNKQ